MKKRFLFLLGYVFFLSISSPLFSGHNNVEMNDAIDSSLIFPKISTRLLYNYVVGKTESGNPIVETIQVGKTFCTKHDDWKYVSNFVYIAKIVPFEFRYGEYEAELFVEFDIEVNVYALRIYFVFNDKEIEIFEEKFFLIPNVEFLFDWRTGSFIGLNVSGKNRQNSEFYPLEFFELKLVIGMY